jgi:hypothetical protein
VLAFGTKQASALWAQPHAFLRPLSRRNARHLISRTWAFALMFSPVRTWRDGLLVGNGGIPLHYGFWLDIGDQKDEQHTARKQTQPGAGVFLPLRSRPAVRRALGNPRGTSRTARIILGIRCLAAGTHWGRLTGGRTGYLQEEPHPESRQKSDICPLTVHSTIHRRSVLYRGHRVDRFCLLLSGRQGLRTKGNVWIRNGHPIKQCCALSAVTSTIVMRPGSV